MVPSTFYFDDYDAGYVVDEEGAPEEPGIMHVLVYRQEQQEELMAGGGGGEEFALGLGGMALQEEFGAGSGGGSQSLLGSETIYLRAFDDGNPPASYGQGPEQDYWIQSIDYGGEGSGGEYPLWTLVFDEGMEYIVVTIGINDDNFFEGGPQAELPDQESFSLGLFSDSFDQNPQGDLDNATVTIIDNDSQGGGGGGGPIYPMVGDITYYVEQKESLAASASIGLLGNDYTTGTNLTITAINGNAFQPGVEITLPSGAKVTVDQYGAITYFPYSGYLGGDTFTFSVVDPYGFIDTGNAEVIVVAAGYNDTDIYTHSFTTNGSLVYNSVTAFDPAAQVWMTLPPSELGSNAQFLYSQNQLTVTSIPRSIVWSPTQAWVTYPVYKGRLPNVGVVGQLSVGEAPISTTHLDVDNFTFTSGQQVVNQVAHVRFDLARVAEDVNWGTYDNDGGGVRDQVNRWFLGVNQAGLTPGNIDTLSGVFEEAADQLDNYLRLVNAPASTGYGYANLAIYLGPLYHTGSNWEKYSTIIHELTHVSSWTQDWGYFQNPTAVQNNETVLFYSTAIPSDQTDATRRSAEYMTTVRRLDNADSYGGFLVQYYSGLVL